MARDIVRSAKRAWAVLSEKKSDPAVNRTRCICRIAIVTSGAAVLFQLVILTATTNPTEASFILAVAVIPAGFVWWLYRALAAMNGAEGAALVQRLLYYQGATGIAVLFTAAPHLLPDAAIVAYVPGLAMALSLIFAVELEVSRATGDGSVSRQSQ